MDKTEATALAEEWALRLRQLPYATLVGRIGQPPVTEEVERGGVTWQIEVTYLWDSAPGGDVRVIVAVDDGGIRARFPVTSDFILSPTGRFVGE